MNKIQFSSDKTPWTTALLLALLFILVCLFFFLNHGDDSAKGAGETFRIGYEDYFPYLYTASNGEPEGYDLDLAREVARRNKWTLVPCKIDWGNKTRLLEQGKVDALWNGLKLTRERAAIYSCSRPYRLSAEVILARNDANINQASDLAGKTLAIQIETPTYNEFTIGSLSALAGELKHLQTFPSSSKMLVSLCSGKVDAIVIDVLVAEEYVKRNPETHIVSPVLFDTLNVVAFRRKDDALREQVIDTFHEMRKDGSFNKLNQKWFGAYDNPKNQSESSSDEILFQRYSGDGLYLDEALRLVSKSTNPTKHYLLYMTIAALIPLLAAGLLSIRNTRRKRDVNRLLSILCNMDERISVMNEAGEVLFAHFPESEDLFWKDLYIKNINEMPIKLRSDLKPLISQMFKTGRPFSYDYEVRGRWRNSRWAPLPLDNPFRCRALTCTSRDTTEQESSFRGLETINKCLDMFLNRTTLVVPFSRVLDCIGNHLNASYCYLAHADINEKLLKIHSEYLTDKNNSVLDKIKPQPFEPDDEWFRRLGSQNYFSWMPLDQEHGIPWFSGFTDPEFAKLHSEPHILLRIMNHGSLWGVLCIFFSGSYKTQIGPSEIQFIRSSVHMIEMMLMREAAQEQLIQSAKAAEAANRAKDYFLATMSHEIRTPLNAVIGFGELLQDETLSHDERTDYLSSIVSAGKSLLSIINDILDLSKLEVGKMVFVVEETDFAQLVSDVGSIFKKIQHEKGLKCDYSVNFESHIFIDKSRARQILFNLLGNAMKFTAQGSITLHADFTENTSENGTLVFTLSDTGIGISDEDQEKLFQPFVQSKNQRGTRASSQGTGLGLAIVKRMIGRMGGTIELKSKLGVGTTFTVTIPNLKYKKCSVKKVAVEEPPLDLTKFNAPLKVLLVDDVPMNLKVFTALLKQFGITPATALSGDEAIASIKKDKPDVVFTDMWMPDMNGADLAAKIREIPGGESIRIIAVSADVNLKENYTQMNFHGVLLKPYSYDNLRKILTDLINKPSV